MFVVKYLNYNMIIMSTNYGLMVHDDQKEEYWLSKGNVRTVNYSEPFAHTYLYRGYVDNHNDMLHDSATT